MQTQLYMCFTEQIIVPATQTSAKLYIETRETKFKSSLAND